MSCQAFEGVVQGAIRGNFADANAIRSAGAEKKKYKGLRARGKSLASFCVKFRDDNACVQTFRLGKSYGMEVNMGLPFPLVAAFSLRE